MPWAKPRHELLILVLVAVAALAPVQEVNSQDWSRMCQTEAYVHLRLTSDVCLGTATGVGAIDRSKHDGHYYSNKAPGLSALAIPAYEIVQLTSPRGWSRFDLRLWAERVLSSGVFFLVGAFLFGRVSEGLAPGFGTPALVTFAFGTIVSSFAAGNFDHVPAMTLGFGALLLLWRKRPLAAGLVTGLALLVEYEIAIVTVALAAYALWQGRRNLVRFVAGVVPGAALLAAYDWAAFGAPWHNPLSYSDNVYAREHSSGFLGVHLPTLYATKLVFVGDRGLLVTSPVLVLAAAGLYLLWRRGLRAEILVAAAVTAAFLVAECGYFIPYGGASPGPRFMIPALPFLGLGLAPAFSRWPRLTTLAAAVSAAAQAALLLTWSVAGDYPGTVWTQIAHMIRHHAHSLLFDSLSKTVFQWLGTSRLEGAALECAFIAAAFVAAFATSGLRPRKER